MGLVMIHPSNDSGKVDVIFIAYVLLAHNAPFMFMVDMSKVI